MPYIKSNGVEIYYEVYGEGEPVALLNGIFMSTDSWQLQTSVLSRKYKVILHDFRGQWKSSKTVEGYTLDQHSDDLKRLLEHLGVHKVNLVGTSYGGWVAVTFTLKYPRFVKSLILIAVPIRSSSNFKVIANRWLTACQTRDPEKFVNAWIKDVYSEEFLNKHWNILWNKLTEIYRDFDFEAGAILLKSACRIIEEENLLAYLRKIEIPTMIIAAEKDVLNPIEDVNLILRETAFSEFHTIDGAGHGVVVEKPEEVNKLILEFLEKHRILADAKRCPRLTKR